MAMAAHFWSWRFRYPFLLVSCLAMVAVADWLFYQAPLGCNTAIYMDLLLVIVMMRAASPMRSWKEKLLVLANVGLIVALVEQPSGLVVFMAITGVGTLTIAQRVRWPRTVPEWAARWWRLILVGWTAIIRDNTAAVIADLRHPGRTRKTPVGLVVRWWLPVGSGM